MIWKPIATAPLHGKQILVGFQGQYDWYSYVTFANGQDTGKNLSFAIPSHWTPIYPPNFKSNEKAS